MKKLITAILIMTGMVFVPQSEAQDRYPQDRYEQRQEQDRKDLYEQDRRDNRRNWRKRGNKRNWQNRGNGRYINRYEYRYIRIGRRVYKEIYNSTYTTQGQLIDRVLISRERVNRYDNYRDNQNGVRFNIFLGSK